MQYIKRPRWLGVLGAVSTGLLVATVMATSSAEGQGRPSKAKPAASAKPAPSAAASGSLTGANARGRPPRTGKCNNTDNKCSGDGETCRDNLCYCEAPKFARCKAPSGDFDDCFDVSIDGKNCGACGKKCAANQECNDGKCEACKRGFSMCHDVDDELGKDLRGCIDLQNDSSHCGKCGHGCPDGWTCLRGHCEP
jgi:hypothetical protein